MYVPFRHEKYSHPNIVLNPNASLMGINKRFAIFAICNESTNVFNHKVGPFFYINQFNHCTHLIRVPLRSFVRLGEQVGDFPLRAKFVLLSNTGRCGSTLLTQLFEEMPNAVAISEPEVLMEFSHEKTFDNFPRNQRCVLLQSCIRLLFKSARQSEKGKESSEIENFLIKPKAHGISIAKDLCYLYPNMKHLYMYRHPAEYVRSIRSLYKSLFPAFVHQLLSSPTFHKWLTHDAFGMNMKEFVLRHIDPRCGNIEENVYIQKMINTLQKFDVEEERNIEQRFSAIYCANLLSILNMTSKGSSSIHVVSYHQLKDNTEACMSRIYQFCNIQSEIDNNHGGNIVTCLPQHDSQANSGISRNSLESYQDALNENEISILNEVLHHCGFPTCDKFPLESDKFAVAFGIPSTTCNTADSSSRTNRQYSCYESGTSKEASKDLYRSTTLSEHTEIQTLQSSNKSIWLPINRFF